MCVKRKEDSRVKLGGRKKWTKIKSIFSLTLVNQTALSSSGKSHRKTGETAASCRLRVRRARVSTQEFRIVSGHHRLFWHRWPSNYTLDNTAFGSTKWIWIIQNQNFVSKSSKAYCSPTRHDGTDLSSQHFGNWRQEDHQFKAFLSYQESLGLAWVTKDPLSKKTNYISNK